MKEFYFNTANLFEETARFLLNLKLLKKKNLYKTKSIKQNNFLKLNKRQNARFSFNILNSPVLQFNFNLGGEFFTHLSYIQNKLLNNIFFEKNWITFKFEKLLKRTSGDGLFYLSTIGAALLIDALLTDDEPLWEPIEWSLVQTWIFFIFLFAWIGENLIASRYGSYTGRDKRVWFAWYKTFWLIELWFALCFGATAMFVIVPFYYELTYSVSFIFSWWNWYNRIFFFKFVCSYTIILFVGYILQLNLKWFNWKKINVFIVVILIFIFYLLYSQFIISFFSYFTDPLWYQKTRFIDYVQLSHEPLKWGWGTAKRDHFTYHKVSTVFWFKNDGPFAAAFLLINLFFFLTIFMLALYWIVLIRKTCATREVSFTFTTYCTSALKQFYYFFFLFYFFILISFIVCYWRFPVEFTWVLGNNSWILCLFEVFFDYLNFIASTIK